ncbi:XRE family transcriptional regulator [Rarobacter faecitabidus]|uniref:XRE family transcriptional regulator n=1 Tax=Rarobacter faecitabidus TaxID=13243 RepID=A0A542ZTP5_RARFA|nr:XRE family transcriptional regulator [Rarobacter faecitabidus]TQL63636.1 XRE family transcriptional regulator [Rarobacter faecitabidus]
MDELALLGPRLRAARIARDLTLEALATRTGISASTLSRLESGKRQAGLEVLLPIVKHLGVSLDALVRTTAPDPRVRRPIIRRDGMVIARLSPEESPTQTAKITYPHRAARPTPKTHTGREWLYVLSGRLRLDLGGQETILEVGEAAEFDTQIPHAMSATGGGPAEVLSIFDEAGARLHTRVSANEPESPD